MKIKKAIKNTLLVLGLIFTLCLVNGCQKSNKQPEPVNTTTTTSNSNMKYDTYNVKLRVFDFDDTNYYRGVIALTDEVNMVSSKMNYPTGNVYQGKDTTFKINMSAADTGAVYLSLNSKINSTTVTPTPRDIMYVHAYRNDTLVYADTNMVFYHIYSPSTPNIGVINLKILKAL